MMPDVHRESGALPQLGEQPQEHRVLGTGRENDDNIAIRSGDPLQPQALGGEEVPRTRDFLTQEISSYEEKTPVREIITLFTHLARFSLGRTSPTYVAENCFRFRALASPFRPHLTFEILGARTFR